MSKYNAGKIYRIDVIGCDEIYIGSCIISLDTRFSLHKRDINTCSSKELFDIGEPVITLIEDYSCESKVELCMREQYYMDLFINDGYTLVNKQRAYTSPAMRKKHDKEYNETHKDVIKERYQKNKEHIKEQQKEYRETRKEVINEYQKEYYETNKDKLTEKFTCECGGRYTHKNKTTHNKTKKHISFINYEKTT